MNKIALEHLEATIQQWEQFLREGEPENVTLGTREGVLCMQFFEPKNGRHPRGVCDGCPVKQDTGKSLCEDTPFAEAQKAYEEWHEAWHSVPSSNYAEKFLAWQEAAKKYLRYLKSLLPSKNLKDNCEQTLGRALNEAGRANIILYNDNKIRADARLSVTYYSLYVSYKLNVQQCFNSNPNDTFFRNVEVSKQVKMSYLLKKPDPNAEINRIINTLEKKLEESL